MMWRVYLTFAIACGLVLQAGKNSQVQAVRDAEGTAFFERRIRPLLVQHCYECHSEQAKEQQGGLLLDRSSGWLQGGDSGKAVVPGEPEGSLLIKAVRYTSAELQMPPEHQLPPGQVQLLEQWVARGAPGPLDELGHTEFSRLGDQEYLFARARDHWAFQPVMPVEPPQVADPLWSVSPIDRFVYDRLAAGQLTPSRMAEAGTLIRRLTFDLTGLPPTLGSVEEFRAAAEADRRAALDAAVGELIDSSAFGEHFARMWLDVARYADTDSFYRPDTRTPHYFPFAFTFRDYVIDAFNADKPFDQFVREQLAADLLQLDADAPEMAALGFLTVGPHANRNPAESLDDWIDVTTRGLMGLTAACARCHDHKYEPIPTADYYSLHGVFASVVRINPLDEKNLPILPGYSPADEDLADFLQKRSVIDAKIEEAGAKTAGNNNRSIARKIRETELAELLLFHPGAPVHTMIVKERGQAIEPVVFLRGDPDSRGDDVPRRFLKILDPAQEPFPANSSGRLQLADKIIDPRNPLTARVFVNRVWGFLMGSHLVQTPSDFGLQGSPPTHPRLLDWLADDFMAHGWSLKRLVRTIVLSRTYQQASDYREEMAAIDAQNRQLWRANRKHLSIEAIRDRMLAVSGQLDRTPRGRAQPLWGEGYTRRRAIYGYINRFNLDPTLRVFDFPTPMQTQPGRGESIVAPQALFTMNAPLVIDQSLAITQRDRFLACRTDDQRIAALFEIVLQRGPDPSELARAGRFVEVQAGITERQPGSARIHSPWPLIAQSLLMSNEFQYID